MVESLSLSWSPASVDDVCRSRKASHHGQSIKTLLRSGNRSVSCLIRELSKPGYGRVNPISS